MGIVEQLLTFNIEDDDGNQFFPDLTSTTADFITRLKGYAEHGRRSDGEVCSAAWVKGAECDCGLSALIKEIEGD